MEGEKKEKEKGIPFNLDAEVAYADGSIISKTLLNRDVGNITLFPSMPARG